MTALVPEPDEEPGRPSGGGLSGRSQTLVELLKPYGDANTLYRDALRILDDEAYETRFRMAAYALRELLEELEQAADIKKPASLGDRVAALRQDWKRVAPSERQDPAGVGEEAARRKSVV